MYIQIKLLPLYRNQETKTFIIMDFTYDCSVCGSDELSMHEVKICMQCSEIVCEECLEEIEYSCPECGYNLEN